MADVFMNTSQKWNCTSDCAENESTATRFVPGLISFATRVLILDVMSCGIEPFPLLLGTLGNMLSLVVLSYQGIKQTTNIILIGLAASDFLYVVSSSIRVVGCVSRFVDPWLAVEIQIYDILYFQKLGNVLGVVSRYHTCFIAVERYIVVHYPLKAASILKRNRMIVASVVLWVFSAVSFIYTFLVFKAEETFNPSLNRTEKTLTVTAFMVQNYDVLIKFASFVNPVLSGYAPVLLVFVCTCLILRSLQQSALQRSQMRHTASATDQQQQQITKTLVSICIVFLMANIPEMIHIFARFLYFDQGYFSTGRYRNIHTVVISVLLFANLINSSVNVVFYMIFNSKFRSTSRKLFGRCLKGLRIMEEDVSATQPAKEEDAKF